MSAAATTVRNAAPAIRTPAMLRADVAHYSRELLNRVLAILGRFNPPQCDAPPEIGRFPFP